MGSRVDVDLCGARIALSHGTVWEASPPIYDKFLSKLMNPVDLDIEKKKIQRKN